MGFTKIKCSYSVPEYQNAECCQHFLTLWIEQRTFIDLYLTEEFNEYFSISNDTHSEDHLTGSPSEKFPLTDTISASSDVNNTFSQTEEGPLPSRFYNSFL
jgi:hypothetical protein